MKKTSAIIVAVMLLVGLLAGCSGSNGGSGKEPAKGGSAAEDSAGTNGGADAGGAKPTIKILTGYWNVDQNKDPLKKIVDEATGYNTEWFMTPQNNPDEKVMVELSSGADYDLIWTSKQMVAKLATQGALMDIGELMDKYAPELRTAFSEANMKQFTYGDKLYAMPWEKNIPYIPASIVIQKNMLDDLGLKIPETLDEFTNVLREIKAKKKVIPLTGTDFRYDTIESAFGISTYWKDLDGELVPMPKQKGMKEYLTYMNQLYKEGLLDPESPANKAENKKEKFVNGTAAATQFFWWDWQLLPVAKENIPGVDIAYLKPLKGKNGEQETVTMAADLQNAYIIPKSAKNPEAAIKFIKEFIKPENFTKVYVGDEGVHWQKAADGTLEPIQPKFADERKVAWTYLAATPDELTKKYFTLSIKGEDPYVFESFNNLYQFIEYGKVDPTISIQTPEAAAKYRQSLDQLEKDYYIKFIAGTEPIENYDKFLQQWDNQGGTDMVKSINEVYKSSK
jgi:putative aldouronate transport system substrate-binding protein